MSEGFLGRWSRRKEAVREGKTVEAEPVVEAEAEAVAPPAQPQAAPEPPSPPPTLQDAESLTPASDFTRFVARDVPQDVKNAALKKLFADPHFNVMDRLDTYIDDYGQPDPLPASWARKLASAQFLDLFDEKKKEQEAAAGREVADDPTAQTVAQSGTAAERDEQAVPPPADTDADPDLRLQQDDAPGRPGPGRGAG